MKDNKDIVMDWLHATLLGDVEKVREAIRSARRGKGDS
jgi:hypothetical protein